MQRSLTLSNGATSKSGLRLSVLDSSTSLSALSLRSRDSACSAYARTGSDARMSSARLESEFSVSTGAPGAAAIASVRPSERMFSARQVIIIARPGKNACHQRPARTPARASARILPHVGVGSAIPAPIKVKDASKMIASATSVTVKTMMGAMQLRRTCFHKIQGARAPETMVALT